MRDTNRVLDILLAFSCTVMGGFAGAAINSGLGPFEEIQWETLVAGSFAVIAALYTVQQMRASEQSAENRHLRNVFVQTLSTRMKIDRVKEKWPKRLRFFARIANDTLAGKGVTATPIHRKNRAMLLCIAFNGVRDFDWSEAQGMPEEITPALELAVMNFRSWLSVIGETIPKEESELNSASESEIVSLLNPDDSFAMVLADTAESAEILADTIESWSKLMIG